VSDFIPLSQFWQGEDSSPVVEDHSHPGQLGAVQMWSCAPYLGDPAPAVMNQCAATTKEGKGCQANGKPWCAGHRNSLRKLGLDPDVTTEWPT